MKTARLPQGEGESLVVWQHVTNVRYVAEGRRRWIVITYQNGMDKNLELHQARDLWYQVEEHKGCPPPCYYHREGDTAPRDCTSCKLAEALEGVDIEVRPDGVPPRRLRHTDWRNCAILCLIGLVILLIMALGQAHPPAPPHPGSPSEPIKGPKGDHPRVPGRAIGERSP